MDNSKYWGRKLVWGGEVWVKMLLFGTGEGCCLERNNLRRPCYFEKDVMCMAIESFLVGIRLLCII